MQYYYIHSNKIIIKGCFFFLQTHLISINIDYLHQKYKSCWQYNYYFRCAPINYFYFYKYGIIKFSH